MRVSARNRTVLECSYARGSTDDRHFRGTSRLVRRRMYDAGVRPQAAILEWFSEPYRGLPLSAPFIFF
jgi:hypothetical protein